MRIWKEIGHVSILAYEYNPLTLSASGSTVRLWTAWCCN